MSQANESHVADEILGAAAVNLLAKNANDAGGFRDTLNAGETLNGATTPVPVYVNTADNELYACDANNASRMNFIGFVTSNSTDGNPINFQGEGIIRGFSGLEEGKMYYIQDTAGTIGTSPGTHSVPVGKAITETELLIIKHRGVYVHDTNELITRGQSTSDLNASLTVEVGFKPRYFEAIINMGIVKESDYSDGNNTSVGEATYYIKGIIGGAFTQFNMRFQDGAWPPTNVNILNPFYDSSGGGEPGYGVGSDTGSTNLSISEPTGDAVITLASVTATETEILFNFTSLQNGSDDDVRYGVRFLHVEE